VTESLNSLISLYRSIQQQHQVDIEPQLSQLSESIARTLSEISEKEQAWIALENAAFCCFSCALIRDARDLIATDDFQTFLEQFVANDPDSIAKPLLEIEPEDWQLRQLTVPLRLKQYHLSSQYSYRIKLGTRGRQT